MSIKKSFSDLYLSIQNIIENMSGQAAIRGFILQTIVCILDAIDLDNNWTELSLEPDLPLEKVDILFFYNKIQKVIQVKSSQNQISQSLVTEWTNDLKRSIQADEYILLLIGPVSQSVINKKEINGVQIPLPKVLDILALIEQAAHKLDKYLLSRGFLPVPAFIREEFISVLITKFEVFSTAGKTIARSDFDQLIQNWIIEIYPKAVMTSFNMQCSLLVDSVTLISKDPFIPIILPCVFLNDGNRTSIIEWIAFKVIGNNLTKLYTPITIVDYEKFLQGKRNVHAENIKSQFSEFAVMSKQMKEMAILFTQEIDNMKFRQSVWTPGKYEISIFIKYQDSIIPKLHRTFDLVMTSQQLSNLSDGITISNMIRKINID